MTTYNTGNPVGSTDARDLYDNSQTLDQLVNGSGTYSNRLGVQRRTLAKLEADFDAQLADAESDLNVYRAESAASAAEAFGYLQAYRATSYGALASDPATDPLGNPPTVGDEYFNTTANLLKRWNGATWQASDINTANLAASSGSSLVGHDGGTVQDVLDAVTGANGSSRVGYTHPGTGAITKTVEHKLEEVVSVFDYMTDAEIADVKSGAPTLDVTPAFNKAQAASNNVEVPDGNYGVKNFRTKTRLNLIAKSQGAAFLEQIDPAQPALEILSDVTTGQLFDQKIHIRVRGHIAATVEAVRVKALSPYAISRGNYDLLITRCYQSIKFETSGSNVYRNFFKITIDETQTTGASLLGGVYNDFDFFCTRPGNGRALEVNGFNNTFWRCVTEGQIFDEGQNTVFINPTIEELPNTPPTAYGIYLNGFNATLVNPTINLSAASSSKITWCIRTYQGAVVINPRLLVNGTLHPFQSAQGPHTWTLIGPGENKCVNKMEAVYDGSETTKDLRRVGRSGELTSFMNGAVTYSGRSTQYSAPTTSTNITVLNSTDALIIEPTATIPTINFALGSADVVRREGQTLSVYTSANITSATWQGYGDNTSLFPSTMTAGQVFTMVYRKSTNKWYPA